MALLTVLRFPDPRLRMVAKPIEKVDATIMALVENMFETMYAKKGVGLAATQVNVHRRLVVTDCSDEQESPQPLVFINPELTKVSDEKETCQEGCLSVPEYYADVERAKFVVVSAMDRCGKKFTMNCEGLLAVCIQHEIDHLNGKLFVDYLSPSKQLLVREKMKKLEKRLIKEEKKVAQTFT